MQRPSGAGVISSHMICIVLVCLSIYGSDETHLAIKIK
jgi:hypothetical protein